MLRKPEGRVSGTENSAGNKSDARRSGGVFAGESAGRGVEQAAQCLVPHLYRRGMENTVSNAFGEELRHIHGSISQWAAFATVAPPALSSVTPDKVS